MTTADQQAHRLVVVELATTLAREARAAAGASEARSPEWHFYRGVEDAALHVLRPQMAAVHENTSWLEREHRAFRDGFLEGQILLGTASAAVEPPMRLPLPEPQIPPPV